MSFSKFSGFPCLEYIRRIALRVPLSSSGWRGTTMTCLPPPGKGLASFACEPFTLTSSYPKRWRALTTSWPETRGSFNLDFYGGNLNYLIQLRLLLPFKVELKGLLDVAEGFLGSAALGNDVNFHRLGNEKLFAFFDDDCDLHL